MSGICFEFLIERSLDQAAISRVNFRQVGNPTAVEFSLYVHQCE